MKETKDFKSGFALIRSGKKIKPVRLRGFAPACFIPNEGQMVRIEFVPESEEQADYGWGEGPAIISQKHIIRRITSDEAFDFLRAQIVTERIQKKFPEIKGFVPVKDGVILISQHLTYHQRSRICEKLLGVYRRKNIYFCATDKIPDDISLIQEALFNSSLPSNWELAQGDSREWADEYAIAS